MIELITIDRRMKGYGKFKFVVDYRYGKANDYSFLQVRKWCAETFGPSVELDAWEEYPDLRNQYWSWERGMFVKSYRCRIFLKDDKAASMFSLRWS